MTETGSHAGQAVNKTPQSSDALVRDRLKQLRQEQRQTADDFIACIKSENAQGLPPCLEKLRKHEAFLLGFRAAARLENVSETVRMAFLGIWEVHGDALRGEIRQDVTLIDGLWRLLPSYSGPQMTLFRGESARNRRYRTYGLSWTADKDVAEDFAEYAARHEVGGGVLLRCVAPATAIISAPAIQGDRYGEQEYLVDRRRLTSIDVLERFSQTLHIPED